MFGLFVVAGSYKPASSPVTMTWTPSGTKLGDHWAHVAVALQPSPTGVAPVGGFVESVNTLAIAAPYLAFFVVGYLGVHTHNVKNDRYRRFRIQFVVHLE